MFDPDRHWPVIRYVTNKVLKTTFPGEYAFEDVLAIALEVASHRHGLWDAGTFPPGRDLEIHVQRVIRTDRYARGWRQAKGSDGKRSWLTHGPGSKPFGEDDSDPALADWTYEPYRLLCGNDDGTYRLASDWPPFTPRQRREFARFMEARYPEVCQGFEDLDREAKPPRVAWARWVKDVDVRRARLRVVYARELAEARFAVTYGSEARSAA